MEPTAVERLNRVLDRLPRDTLHLGARTVPAFRSIGILGFHLAVLAAVLTAIRAGVPVLEAVGISATAGASFFAFGLLRRAMTGRENLVLLEHVWVALGSVALYLWAAGGPVLPGLDVLSAALCVFLAAGRVGCLIAGCCHGHPASIGPVYPAAAGLPDRLHGVRLFPVQLVESAGLLGIGAIGFVLAGSRPGTATVWVLTAYATVRFGVEALRGDRRPNVVGVSVPRAMAVMQLLAVAESARRQRRPVKSRRRLLRCGTQHLTTAGWAASHQPIRITPHPRPGRPGTTASWPPPEAYS